jgi:hypothetical protein
LYSAESQEVVNRIIALRTYGMQNNENSIMLTFLRTQDRKTEKRAKN